MANNIYDEINLNINPFQILGIEENSNSFTIKEAYLLLKKSSLSPQKKAIVETAYNMIKTDTLRARYKLIKNRPFESLDDIKKLGLKPQILEINQWVNYIL